jgi:predicted secreted protein
MAAEFKPNTAYQWSSDTEFSISGKEFEALGLLVRTLQNEPEYQKYQMVNTASILIDEILKKNIDKIQEMKPQEQT